MFNTLISRLAIGATLAVASVGAMSSPVAISTADPANGLTMIFSTSINGALAPCTGADPAWCSFFGGKPGAVNSIALTPNPTGIANLVPGGITPTPASGSYLDLEQIKDMDNKVVELKLTGGVVAFPAMTITIGGTTVINPSGVAGFVFDAAPQVTSVNAAGEAEFLVNLSPAFAADFSTFSTIVQAPDCTGPLCGLIGILSLDMVRYRLFIDYDDSFSSFTATFRGQTATAALIDTNLNSVPVPAAAWLMVPAIGAVAARARRRKA